MVPGLLPSDLQRTEDTFLLILLLIILAICAMMYIQSQNRLAQRVQFQPQIVEEDPEPEWSRQRNERRAGREAHHLSI